MYAYLIVGLNKSKSVMKVNFNVKLLLFITLCIYIQDCKSQTNSISNSTEDSVKTTIHYAARYINHYSDLKLLIKITKCGLA